MIEEWSMAGALPDFIPWGSGYESVLWVMGLNTHIAGKSTQHFTTFPSLVLIKLILGKIQPFKNSKFY